MKTHTSDFKNNVKLFGRELDSIISYTLNNEDIELGNENLNSISPHYEGSILKSVMKQLDIECDREIPEGTELNYQFGVKVRDEEVEDYRDNYDYVDFGNYIVYKSEKQEDTRSYKITCYDKMLYAMKDYESMGITYPITIRDYINTICNHLGLTFKNRNETFANYNQQINSELYLDAQGNSLGYTFRDVLDELAQVTASTICINESSDVLEVRYINTTGDTIDEEYLKDINVNFGESYGPINTIVLSRSAGADNISLSYPENLPDDEKIAVKIVDNQIMNGNDRDNYLSDILNRLLGLEYYLNDFSSTGITYYNLCDRYNVQIGNETYSCVMFNDDINITQGLEENIHTDMPEEAKTDYTKADKTDRRINQTYLIVDKQNQVIEGVISQVSEQDETIAEIRLQYNELLSRISEIADITTSGESSYASVNLVGVNASNPISIKIHPIITNISLLYPSNTLYPSNSLYPKSRKLKFENTDTQEVFYWSVPTDLWYYSQNIYDELELSYGDGTNSIVTVTRRCGLDSNGNVIALETPTTETYPYPQDLFLTDGDYVVSLMNYNSAYLYVQLMAKNIYTTQFYTKAETNSIIDQTKDEIELQVSQTLTGYSTTSEMNAAINLKANEINSVVSTKVGKTEVISSINQTAEQIKINANKIKLEGYTTINDSFKIDTNGNFEASGGLIGGINISGQGLFYSGSSANDGFGLWKNNVHWDGSGHIIFHAGGNSSNIGGSPFRIYQDGRVAASSGAIGGWNLLGSGIYGNSTAKAGLYTNGNMIMAGDYGMIKFDTNPVRINSASLLLLSDNYNASTMASQYDTISIRAFNGQIHINSNYGVYAGANRLDSSSSKKVKKNIKPIKQKLINEIYEEVKKMPMYTYDYKEKYGDKNHFGFILEDLENTCLKNILRIEQNKEDKNIKYYSQQSLEKMNTLLIQELMKKIEKLEKGK